MFGKNLNNTEIEMNEIYNKFTRLRVKFFQGKLSLQLRGEVIK